MSNISRRGFMQGVMAALAASAAAPALAAGSIPAPTGFVVRGLKNPSVTDFGNGWFRVSGGVDPKCFSVPFDIGEAGIKALSSGGNMHFSFFCKAENGGHPLLSEDGVDIQGETFKYEGLQLEFDRPPSGPYMDTPRHNLLTNTENVDLKGEKE